MPDNPPPPCLITTDLAPPWTTVPAMILGDPATTPDAHVLVGTNDAPRLRLDIHCPTAEAWTSHRTAEIWNDWIVVGFGCRVELIALTDATRNVIPLSDRDPPSGFDYFCRIATAPDVLIVTSGTRAFRIGPDATILWRSAEIGADGVLIHDIGPDTVSGEGSWDPPDIWTPFVLSLATGR